jgi:hypothetical protein
VLADQRQLLERIRRTARAHPVLLARLRPMLSVSAQHVDALVRAGPSHRLGTRPVRVPSLPTQAIDDLQGHLRRASRDRIADCVEARSGAFARLLASVAAGVAQEAVSLGTAS